MLDLDLIQLFECKLLSIRFKAEGTKFVAKSVAACLMS